MGSVRTALRYVCLAAGLALGSAPVAALTDDQRDSGESVGLFARACISNAGDAHAVRAWAMAHHLPAVSEAVGHAFLRGMGTGIVFSASNDSGNFALLSFDDGRCSVIAEKGDMSAAQDQLIAVLNRIGIEHEAQAVWLNLDGLAQQYIYRATLNGHVRVLSVTTNKNSQKDTPWLTLTIEGA